MALSVNKDVLWFQVSISDSLLIVQEFQYECDFGGVEL